MEALWILLEVMEVSHDDGREGVTWTRRPWNQIDLKAGTMQYTGFNNKTSALDITYTVNWCQEFFNSIDFCRGTKLGPYLKDDHNIVEN